MLIAVLNWGFAHATRCVLIIQSNNRVVFVGNIDQIKFIRREFSNLESEFLDRHNVQLSSNKNTYFQILNQLYKIGKAFNADGSFVKEMCGKYFLDLIYMIIGMGLRILKLNPYLLVIS